MNVSKSLVIKDKIAGRLIEANLISQDDLNKAVELQKKDGGSLGLCLVRAGAISDNAYAEFLGKVYNLPVVNIEKIEIGRECLALIPADVATKFQVLPLRREGRILTVAMANPTNIFAIDDIKFITGLEVQPRGRAEAAIKRAIDAHYDSADSLADVMKGIEDDIEIVEDDEDDGGARRPGVEPERPGRQARELAASPRRCSKGASDIHVEPYEKNLRVRYRIDGVLAAR